MPQPRSLRFAGLITTRWRWVVMVWLVVTPLVRWSAPSWDQIAFDGDFDHLPPGSPSVIGERILDEAFPGVRGRSQIVLVLHRDGESLAAADEILGWDLLRRLHHRLAEVSWRRALAEGFDKGVPEEGGTIERWLRLARESLDQSIRADQQFYELLGDRVPDAAPTATEPRMAIAYWDRAVLGERMGAPDDEVAADYEAALVLFPQLAETAVPIERRDLDGFDVFLDLVSWDDAVVGRRLRVPGARLAVMRLTSELAATANVRLVESVSELLDQVRGYGGRFVDPGVDIAITGSAAIGGETLIAARDAIRYTELFTVLLVLAILVIVYRAPLLVIVPLVSIGFAVMLSTAIVSWIAYWSLQGSVPGLDLRVFTTSRIFVFVILFGAGTDYCLFLIARLREEAREADWEEACRRALGGVTGALLGSALTTIVGLGMLWIADFGKFHHTGPIIAICLSIGLVTCTTLTPALLRGVGPALFWPATSAGTRFAGQRVPIPRPVSGGFWARFGLWVTRYPLVGLLGGWTLLAIPAVGGLRGEDRVTYDLTSELSATSASRRGLEVLSSHFPIGETNPLTVLLLRPDDRSLGGREALEDQVKSLKRGVYELPGVATVRTADDPLGAFPPDREMGLLRGDAWRRRALRNHRLAQQHFFSDVPDYRERLIRFDVVVDGDPFSLETVSSVSRIGDHLRDALRQAGPEWEGTQVHLLGTTPSIMDLRAVTMADNRRIKVAVVLAVFCVLWLVIRRVSWCLYLIATVLLSYYATLGLTLTLFRLIQGPDFIGLDWKLPLFLFVILVAVGQDYNVYLVTRILEERRRMGRLSALRRAVSRTGGIITACGLVMAGTFFSMTTSAWVPLLAQSLGLGPWTGSPEIAGRSMLRGVVELGFALGLGVLIDTFYVRTILVPSFIAWRWQRRRAGGCRRP